jgi:hypothetical protein
MLAKTGNLKLTQQLLGHADIKSTMRYAHALEADLRLALDGPGAEDTHHPLSSRPLPKPPHGVSLVCTAGILARNASSFRKLGWCLVGVAMSPR